jgi:hypothetical protein
MNKNLRGGFAMKKIFLFTMMFILVACWTLFQGSTLLLGAEKMIQKEMPAKTGEMKEPEGMMKKEGETMKEQEKMKKEGEMMKEEKEMKGENKMMKEKKEMK